MQFEWRTAQNGFKNAEDTSMFYPGNTDESTSAVEEAIKMKRFVKVPSRSGIVPRCDTLNIVNWTESTQSSRRYVKLHYDQSEQG